MESAMTTHIPTWLERYQADPHKHTATYSYMADEIKELREFIDHMHSMECFAKIYSSPAFTLEAAYEAFAHVKEK
jgi:hypothetical protein